MKWFALQAAGAVFAVFPFPLLFQNAEGFAISSPSNHLFCLPIPSSPHLFVLMNWANFFTDDTKFLNN
jgi:hypothetical protein